MRDEIVAFIGEEFFEKAKHRLEHPTEYAMNAISKAQIEKIWQSIFTKPPTITDLRTATPSSTLIYRQNRDFNGSKSQLAADLSVNWNTFILDIASTI